MFLSELSAAGLTHSVRCIRYAEKQVGYMACSVLLTEVCIDSANFALPRTFHSRLVVLACCAAER